MKIKNTILLLALSGFASAATVVSSAGGSYIIQGEDFDSFSGSGTVTAHASYVDLFASGTTATIQFDFSGLDLVNESYTISIDAYTRTGWSGSTISSDFGLSENISVTSWSGAFDAYTLASGQDLTTSSFTTTVTGAAHIDYFDVVITNTSTTVPEPSSAALIGLGALSLLARRKR